VRLPLVCRLERDEPLLSWLSRIAWDNRCSVAELMDHCDVRFSSCAELALGPSDGALERISRATTVSVDDLRGAGLRRVLVRAGEPDCDLGQGYAWPQYASSLARAHISIFGGWACPSCLVERGGAVAMRWLHRLSACCITHDNLLVNVRDPRFGKGLPLLGRTLQPPGAPPSPRDRWALADASQKITIDWRDRGLARTIDAILEGHTDFAGRSLPAGEASRTIWCLALLLARFVKCEDLSVDAPRRRALRTFLAGRPATRTRLREPSTHLRRDHAALAAFAPSAWAIAFGADDAFRDDLLDRLAARIRAPENRNTARIQSYYRHLPTWVRGDISRRVRLTGSQRLARAGLPATRHARAHAALPASRVPQMLWPTVFTEAFAASLPGLTPGSARTLCSILLLRIGPCSNLKDASNLLGQRGRPAVASVPSLIARTDSQPLQESFSHRLQAVQSQLHALKPETDYAALRLHYERCTALWPDAAGALVGALSDAERIDSQTEATLMTVRGRVALTTWIWVHATHSRVDTSANYGARLGSTNCKAIRGLIRRHLYPNRDELLERLETYHGMPLREPRFLPVG
jgi:hypothetical protein